MTLNFNIKPTCAESAHAFVVKTTINRNPKTRTVGCICNVTVFPAAVYPLQHRAAPMATSSVRANEED